MDFYTSINRKIGDILTSVENGMIGLPDLQRPFVWKDNKVRDLLDSMLKEYKIILSSASNELHDVRDNVIRMLLQRNSYFPIALEFFTTSDDTFDMLYGYLQQTDVYVLVIGDDNGSLIGSDALPRIAHYPIEQQGE